MNYKKNYLAKQKGQVALIVLLVSAVVMTLGLSAAKKTVVDTKVETDQQQLKQAFNAAESGIEYYLGTGTTQFSSLDSVSKADVDVKNIGNGVTINFDQYNQTNSNLEFWLVSHLANGDIGATYYTGNSLSLCVESTFRGALKVDYFYKNGGNYNVGRYGYNFASNYVPGFSNLSPLPGQLGCIANYMQLLLTTPLAGNQPLLLSVKPIGSGTRVYLLGSGQAFPPQGVEITSTGRVGDINTGVNRKLSVKRLYQVPGFAMDAITSFGDVLSN